MAQKNDNDGGGNQSQGRYVYQAYKTLPAVTSIEDFAIKMLNIVSGGNSDKHHKQFLTNKLNEIGNILHRQKQGWQISYDEKMTLLMAETWSLNHMMNSVSTLSIFVVFVFFVCKSGLIVLFCFCVSFFHFFFFCL